MTYEDISLPNDDFNLSYRWRPSPGNEVGFFGQFSRSYGQGDPPKEEDLVYNTEELFEELGWRGCGLEFFGRGSDIVGTGPADRLLPTQKKGNLRHHHLSFLYGTKRSPTPFLWNNGLG